MPQNTHNIYPSHNSKSLPDMPLETLALIADDLHVVLLTKDIIPLPSELKISAAQLCSSIPLYTTIKIGTLTGFVKNVQTALQALPHDEPELPQQLVEKFRTALATYVAKLYDNVHPDAAPLYLSELYKVLHAKAPPPVEKLAAY